MKNLLCSRRPYRIISFDTARHEWNLSRAIFEQDYLHSHFLPGNSLLKKYFCLYFFYRSDSLLGASIKQTLVLCIIKICYSTEMVNSIHPNMISSQIQLPLARDPHLSDGLGPPPQIHEPPGEPAAGIITTGVAIKNSNRSPSCLEIDTFIRSPSCEPRGPVDPKKALAVPPSPDGLLSIKK